MGAYEQAAEARMAAAKAAQAKADALAMDELAKKQAAAAAVEAAKKVGIPTAAADVKPDPTTTAYTDLTPAERAAMSTAEKTAYLEAARQAKMAEEAAARAASDPMKDFSNRPDAPEASNGKLYYYAWVGGVNSGSWKLYSAVDNPENQAKYGGRSAGGATAASATSAVGANTLNTPSVWDPVTGTWKAPGTKVGTFVTVGGILQKDGEPYTGVYNGKNYVNGKTGTAGSTDGTDGTGGKKEVSRVDNGDGTFTITYDDGTTEITGTKNTDPNKPPIGTPPAFVYDPVSKTWKMPAKPTGPGTWVWDNNNGWVDSTVNPGPTGMATGSERTLALDTFRNTLGLLFGAKEASQPWVAALFTVASKFYNSGSTIDEALNLSLQDIRNNKDLKAFTDRFKGIYALTDRLAKGEAIEVPTIAEYFKSESSMGDILRAAGMGELATQDFLGDIIGRGKSVLEVTNLITDTFDRIDNAPSALKADLLLAFPGADRASIAKAMLTGVAGAAELTKKVKAISVQSAAKTQGITINDLTSQDIAAQGYDYNKSLQGFATVAQTAERGATLGRMSGIDLTQQEAIASAFGSNAAADEKLRKIREEEANRFSATSGRLASQNRTAGLI